MANGQTVTRPFLSMLVPAGTAARNARTQAWQPLPNCDPTQDLWPAQVSGAVRAGHRKHVSICALSSGLDLSLSWDARPAPHRSGHQLLVFWTCTYRADAAKGRGLGAPNPIAQDSARVGRMAAC
ncbi:hypothetical protein BT67DRAFT_444947 [Trichocladium antarcticum]|uniref:Uncharacterized protein n=1 Tax=Trichocladium antarcticum TaxID=1450529 RepID=A0AAN6UGE3_9PEZI|nr:hypothetical protein BT67DRAFT_444947 [Trichocladium antarcticum]